MNLFFRRKRVKIVDVETLIEGANNFELNENPQANNENPINTIDSKNVNPNKKDNKKKAAIPEISEEEKKQKEQEELDKKNFLENFANKKINFEEKIKLFNLDDLLNVDDEDESEIELRIIESVDDDRIMQDPENTNKFPIELLEYDNNLDELIRKLNLK